MNKLITVTRIVQLLIRMNFKFYAWVASYGWWVDVLTSTAFLTSRSPQGDKNNVDNKIYH